MTIRRVERLVRAAGFEMRSFEAVPVRKFRWLHSRLTREFTTAIMRARFAPTGPA